MRTFSRWMLSPSQPSRVASAAALAALVGLAAGGIWLVVAHPWLLVLLVVIVVLGCRSARADEARRRHLIAERAGEGLCTFARAIPRDARDAWAIRACYAALSAELAVDGQPLRLRPSDRLIDDLQVDDDHLTDLLVHVAKQIGRDLRAGRVNPYYGRVLTVGDAVRL